MNRRSFLAGTTGVWAFPSASMRAHESTPVSLSDAPWLSGSSALRGVPDAAVAEPGSVQVVSTSQVLYKEFATILIHNATDHAVMLRTVRGTLTVDNLPGFERRLGAYAIPDIILPPNEYWIARLKVPGELSIATDLTFESAVELSEELPLLRNISTLLTAIPPGDAFALPNAGETWPIRYSNDAPYPAGRYAMFQQVFFNEAGDICGFISADSAFEETGEATFLMRETSSPPTSTGGVPLGDTSDRWIAQWSHQPGWPEFDQFEFDN